MAGDVAQLHMLEVVPDPLVRIEVWGIPRQLLQAEVFGCWPRQERLDFLVAVYWYPIPDHQQTTVKPAPQMSEEAHYIWSLKRVLLHLCQQLPLHGYPADHREMIP